MCWTDHEGINMPTFYLTFTASIWELYQMLVECLYNKKLGEYMI